MENNEHLANIRHTLAHLLAQSALEHYPKAQLTLGPAVDNGFYYDIDFGEDKINDENLAILEKTMKKNLSSWKEFTHKEASVEEARKYFNGNTYKLELIDDIVSRGEKITLYTCGDFTDLCRGGHVEHPAKEIKVDSFKLDRVAGAYWRGSELNKMLTRIYGLAFDTKEELDNYVKMREEAKNRDHKKLGKELDLFFIDEEVGKGLPLWTPKGTVIKYELEKFTRDLEIKYGYEHVSTPYLGGEKLYQTSGHLSHFKQNMYAPIDMDGDLFYLRPMACPHHIKMVMRKPISYKDLPIRYAEIADYNRYEKSGELMGMIRVRKFQLTDGHLFVTPEQLKDEFKKVCKMIQEGMIGLGLSEVISYRFSKRDPKDKEKYYADDNLWEKAEKLMSEALNEINLVYEEAEGEAAFYGPKLDIQIKNVNGKEDTIFTAQIDFLLPEKFNIEYTAEDGSKKRPVMIHRSAIGCLERTFAFMIEQYAGAFPLWLSPVQVIITPISEKQNEYAGVILNKLKEENIRVELDDSSESLGKKIRNAKMQKTPYIIVIGDKEKESNTITVEGRTEKLENIKIEKFLEKLKKEISEKTLN
ncbi:MAG: threonine--tRNA ligase [Candidatus Paceibacterota bacterium]|jgi:threonyl-tRNA synthetase